MLVVCAQACLLWLLSVADFRNCRVVCLPVLMSAPNPGRFFIVVSVSRMHFSSCGGVLGNVDFDELRSGLSSSYVIALLFADGADYSVRFFVITRALRLFL